MKCFAELYERARVAELPPAVTARYASLGMPRSGFIRSKSALIASTSSAIR